MDLWPEGAVLLLKAVQFAAHKHRDQRRNNKEASPYINHPIDVANLLAGVGGISDLVTLIGAVLHDTIEDTETTPEELEAEFGPEVRELVAEVTDDKSLPKEVRKQLQIDHAPHRSERAKAIKLGDKICNLLDVTSSPPHTWSLERRTKYLEWTERVIAGCRGTNERLERRYDEVLRAGRVALGLPR